MKHMRRWAIVLAAALTAGAASAATEAPGPVHVLKDGQWVRQAPPLEGSAAGEISLLRECADKGSHAEADKLAKKLLKRPDLEDETREEVMCLAGQANLNGERYYQAYEWFKRQLDSYPSGPYSQRALDREFKIAEAFLAGKKRIVGNVLRLPATDEGLEILAKIAEQSPKTAIAERAMLRIPDYHYAKREFVEAGDTYDQFLSMFPKSASASYAALHAARAHFYQYEGASHEETPLIEAQQRLKTFQANYPRDAEEAGVGEMLKQITTYRAQTTFETARFYERTGHGDAALYYYRRLQQEYPETTWAAQSAGTTKRLEAGVQAAKPRAPAWQYPPESGGQTVPEAGSQEAPPEPTTQPDPKTQEPSNPQPEASHS